MERLPRPVIECPKEWDLEKYLYYRNIMDKYWNEKDRYYMKIYGNNFWPYKLGTVINYQNLQKYAGVDRPKSLLNPGGTVKHEL